MRKIILGLFLLLCILSLPHKAQAQGGFYRDISLQWNGVSLIPNAGAQVTICSAAGIGNPCTPTITIYSNAALTVTQTNPITTGSDGSWSLYLTPGQYSYTVTGTGLNPQGPFLFSVPPAMPTTLLNYQSIKAPITGNAADQVMYSYVLPANTVISGRGIRISVAWNHSTGTATINYKFRINGVNQTFQGVGTAGAHGASAIYMASSATGLDVNESLANASGTIVVASGAGSATWTSAQTFDLVFNVANTDAVTPNSWVVELLQ